MANITIRNLDESLKSRLRMRAASRGRSMEEEARQILRAALNEPAVPGNDLGSRIRQRFEPLGDVQLPLPAREPMREPPAIGDAATPPRCRRSTGNRSGKAGRDRQ
jgi:plasmid stability protein